jgi:putative membrane protein insertion efficiency factor
MITRLVVFLIHAYRRLVSPFLPPRCRFDPTCSRYAIHAIEHHGLQRGGWMALKRLFRCHPFGTEWGYDPVSTKVPANTPGRFSGSPQKSAPSSSVK